MDPKANLREQEEVAREIRNLIDKSPTDSYGDLPESVNRQVVVLADRLAQLVGDYVEWRRKGGAA